MSVRSWIADYKIEYDLNNEELSELLDIEYDELASLENGDEKADQYMRNYLKIRIGYPSKTPEEIEIMKNGVGISPNTNKRLLPCNKGLSYRYYMLYEPKNESNDCVTFIKERKEYVYKNR